MNHWEAMLSHPNEWVEQWHILRPDGDFRDVTKSNEDTLHTSGSYDVTRSSPDDDGEMSDDDDGGASQERSTSNQAMPTLILPSDVDGEEAISLLFPRISDKKASDDYEFLTKENPKSISASSMKSSEGAGKVHKIIMCAPYVISLMHFWNDMVLGSMCRSHVY